MNSLTSVSTDYYAKDSIHPIHAQMEQSFQRSATLVIWYKAHAEPIRLQTIIPTFPLFQLSYFPGIISDLGITPAVYLDTYNPTSQVWEQSTITTVRMVERDQRLLYRVRRSLLQGLNDDECIGLANEMALQAKPHLKRPSIDLLPQPSAKRPHLTPPSPSASIAPTTPEPSPLEGTSRRWPNDYTVSEVSTGFNSMESLSTNAPGPVGASHLTRKAAFERVFEAKYVKSTVCRHLSVWRRADTASIQECHNMPWNDFVRRIEGKPPRGGDAASRFSISEQSLLADPIMGSLQGPDLASLYDPSLLTHGPQPQA